MPPPPRPTTAPAPTATGPPATRRRPHTTSTSTGPPHGPPTTRPRTARAARRSASAGTGPARSTTSSTARRSTRASGRRSSPRQSLYVAGPDCYVNNPNTISVSGGYLNLSGSRCRPFRLRRAATRSPYQAGMVTTRSLFTQTYGAFEVNAKLPVGDRARAARDVLALPAEPHVRDVAGLGRDRLRRVLQPVPQPRHPLRPLQLHDQRPATRRRTTATSTRRSSTPTGSTGRRRRSRSSYNGNVCLTDYVAQRPGAVQPAVLHRADPGARRPAATPSTASTPLPGHHPDRLGPGLDAGLLSGTCPASVPSFPLERRPRPCPHGSGLGRRPSSHGGSTVPS